MVHEKPHRDVFGGEEFDVLLLGVAPAPVKNKDGTVIEVAQALSESLQCPLEVWDEDFLEPTNENITVDVGRLCPVNGDVLLCQASFEQAGIQRLVVGDDCGLETRPVRRNAPNKVCSVVSSARSQSQRSHRLVPVPVGQTP